PLSRPPERMPFSKAIRSRAARFASDNRQSVLSLLSPFPFQSGLLARAGFSCQACFLHTRLCRFSGKEHAP
ncbi:hypothetical protein, partial [uncultured Desulfovibrio sp.]|uniref:hypothetical protein n=1 Tax=uncultured Desulfovibrio sp. TaxID=167968 RepID=UPI0026125672